MINLKNINKKYLYIGSAVFMLLWIAFLSSKTKISTPTNNNTIPVIPSQNQKSPRDIKVSDIVPVANTTPFGLGNYSIKNNKLVFTLPEGNGYEIDTKDQPVTDFNINNSVILITTGEIYSTASGYFLHNITTNETYPIKTDKIEPIVSISSSPDAKSVTILGNLKTRDYTTSLYLQNITNNQNILLLNNLSRNYVHQISNNLILLGKEIDKPEPNLIFDLYNTSSNAYLTKDILSSKKTLCSNSTSLFYLDYKEKKIKKINFTSGKSENLNITETKFPNFLCDDSNLYLVLSNKNKIEIKNINLSTLSIDEKNKSLKEKQILIQSYLQKGNLLFKTYDYSSKSFSFTPAP